MARAKKSKKNAEIVEISNKLTALGVDVPENAALEDLQCLLAEKKVEVIADSECFGRFYDPSDPTCVACGLVESCLIEVSARESKVEAEIVQEEVAVEAQAEALADEVSSPESSVVPDPVVPPVPKQKAPRSAKSSVDVASFAKGEKGKLTFWSDSSQAVEITFARGDRVKVVNSKSVHHGKVGTVKNYSPKYDDLWVTIDGHTQAVTAFKPHHVLPVV